MSKLSTQAIVQGMADALPTHQKGDDGSDLASSYEAIALLVHSYFAALDFKLCGFDEDKNLAEASSLAPRLPPQWNTGFGSLSFVYRHKQSSMTFVIRVDRMGAKVEVRGLAVGDENIYRFERAVRDVVQSSGLPVRITMTEGGEDRSDLAEKLAKIFVSEQAISSVLRDLKVNIVQRLIPKLQREDYVEEAEAQANARAERRAQEGRPPPITPFNSGFPHQDPFRPPLVPGLLQRRSPPIPDFAPPRFEDEHQMNQPRLLPPMIVPQSPVGIGHDDLNPPGLGPRDPLTGVGGILRPRPSGGAGMYPTLEDLVVNPREMREYPGGYNLPGYDPQVPPGARWDPTGPDMGPRHGGRGNGPFGGYGGQGGGFGDII